VDYDFLYEICIRVNCLRDIFDYEHLYT